MPKNWMTTLFGLLSAVGIAISQVPGLNDNKTVQTIGAIVAVVGVAGTGLSAKDKNVTGAGATARKVDSGSI